MKIFILIFFFEKFGNLEFFQGIENLDFFFFEEFGNLEFFQGIENFDWWFFFFEGNLRSTSPMALVPRPFLKIFFFFFSWKDLERIDFFFFFLIYEDLFIIKKWRRWRWRWSKSDEDLFMMIFFFVKKPILWMRKTLDESWCGLLDKS